MTRLIDRAFADAIANGVFPAAELVVGKRGEVAFASHYGAARKDTCFDIASLTKPVVTATLAMILCRDGLIKLSDTVYQWLAGAKQPAHRQITVAHLIDHVSGLPAWQPYFRELPMAMVGTEEGKEMILGECYSEEPKAKPGKKTIYSDIGYIILGEILEQAAGERLDTLFAKKIAEPLGLSDTFFVRVTGAGVSTTSRRTKTKPDQHVPTPKHGAKEERPKRRDGEHRRFAPTEDCPWRERVIHGEVHDQNAYAMGGVAGHAGLFSTAADLHRFALEFVRSFRGESNLLPTDTLKRMIGEAGAKPAGEIYVGGWNRPSRKNSTSGRFFSPNTIGHLAYTGCSLWMDLENDFWVALITNRVHPTSTNQKIAAFRPKIHDLIYTELIEHSGKF